MSVVPGYEVTIGLEVHVQVRTNSKMFCRCANRMLAPPNTNICPVCMGYPGVLPVPNREAIRKTLLAGLMLGCDIAPYSKFDRKSYFYPDMPKNFQISQYDLPFCVGGGVPVEGRSLDGEVEARTIPLTRIHLEEDVAKSTHFETVSGIDFNRAGVPLMEIVSEPAMTTPDEAYAYLVALKQVVQYADISDCSIEKGQMRVDVNVSVRPTGQAELNAKTEIKNVGSFKAVHHALSYEIERQVEQLEDGGVATQDTRGWDDAMQATYLLRSKESAHDYRYFPEPDLMPIEVDEAMLEELRTQLPETPTARRRRFQDDLGLPEYDAGVLTGDKAVADYFEACVAAGADPKQASNWIMTEILGELSRHSRTVGECRVQPADLAALLKLLADRTVNGKIAKKVLATMFATGQAPDVVVKEQGLVQVTDTDAVMGFVRQAIAANPDPVAQYREGKTRALQFLVGQVMRFSRGKANPQMAAEMLKQELDG